MQNTIDFSLPKEVSLLVILDDKKIEYKGKGIKPLFDAMQENDLCGATIIDKVVGRTAALLMVKAKVKNVFAITISNGAIDILKDYQVLYQAQKTVPVILNNKGDDLCPMEKLAIKHNNPDEIYNILLKKFTVS